MNRLPPAAAGLVIARRFQGPGGAHRGFTTPSRPRRSHDRYGAEAGTLATQVIKLGRALGIVLLLATQRPD
jgi:hypothetical protein